MRRNVEDRKATLLQPLQMFGRLYSGMFLWGKQFPTPGIGVNLYLTPDPHACVLHIFQLLYYIT